MGIIGFEYTMSHMTVERAMKISLHADQVLLELLPQFFGTVERLEGVGDVGSTRGVTLGPGVPGAAGMKVTERLTVNNIVTNTLLRDCGRSSIQHFHIHIKIHCRSRRLRHHHQLVG